MGEGGIITGVVRIRRCPHCGHHEVGIVDEKGNFYPLKEGMHVRIFSPEQKESPPSDEKKKVTTISEEKKIPSIKAWVPEIIKDKKRLRLKYGVLFNPEEGEMDITKYKIAYIKKVQTLIEKENYPNLVVTLDRFFRSPHLASGNSAEVTMKLLRDISDIRRPVKLMEEYLTKGTKESLEELISPLYIEDLADKEPVSDEEFIKELQELTFEEFLMVL